MRNPTVVRTKEVVTVTPATTESMSRHDLDTEVRIPETVPEFLEPTRPPTRRRTWLIATALAVAAVVVGAVLLVLRPWEEETTASTYTGDWKDSIADTEQIDTGDWKDSLTGTSEQVYTGDWKDSIAG